jgi:hypothetical protein
MKAKMIEYEEAVKEGRANSDYYFFQMNMISINYHISLLRY